MLMNMGARPTPEKSRIDQWLSYHVSYKGSPLPLGRLPSGWRGYEHRMFEKAFKACNGDYACERGVRVAYHQWERGRIWAVLDKFHLAVTKFDLDEMRDFKKKYPKLLELLNEYAVIEEVKVI